MLCSRVVVSLLHCSFVSETSESGRPLLSIFLSPRHAWKKNNFGLFSSDSHDDLIGCIISFKLISSLSLAIILSSIPCDMTTQRKQSESEWFNFVIFWISSLISLAFRFSWNLKSNSRYSRVVFKFLTSGSDHILSASLKGLGLYARMFITNAMPRLAWSMSYKFFAIL